MSLPYIYSPHIIGKLSRHHKILVILNEILNMLTNPSKENLKQCTKCKFEFIWHKENLVDAMHELSGLKLLTGSRLNFNHFNERTLQHKTTTSNTANYIWPQNRPLKRRICSESNFKKFFRWSPVIALF